MCVNDIISLYKSYSSKHDDLSKICSDWRDNHRQYYDYVMERTKFIKLYGNKNIYYSFEQRLYYVFNNITQFPLCPTCGLPNVTNKVTIDGYSDISKYCKKCFRGSKEYKQRIFDKYGCYNVSCCKEIQDKKNATTKLHYGVENPSQCKQICDKRNETIFQRFGTSNVNSLQEIKDKIKQTNMERFGVDNASKLDLIKQKKIDTSRRNFGKDYWFQTDVGKQHLSECSTKSAVLRMSKCKQTNLRKYGSEHFMKTNEYKMLFRRKCRTDTYENFVTKSQYTKPLFDVETYIQKPNELLDWVCCKCGNSFKDYCCHDTKSIFNHVGRCPLCYPLKTKTTSLQEIEIKNFLVNFYNSEIECNVRNVIQPYELDIYLKDLKFGIEFNGLYWHSELYRNQDYHQKKHDICVSKGIRLFNIWEDEWYQHKEVVKSQIRRIFNSCEIINDFDKCCSLDKQTCVKFIHDNSIYFDTTFDICYGCFKNDVLICVLTIDVEDLMDNKYVLKHYCVKNEVNTTVGFDMMLSCFKQEYFPFVIKYDYYDDWYCNDDFLLNSNFELLNINEPYCLYYKNDKRFTLQTVLKNIDRNESINEDVDILNNGYYRIYDIGPKTYIWKKGNANGSK